MDQQEALMILHHMPRLGTKKVLSLVEFFGSAKKSLEATVADWKECFLGDETHFYERSAIQNQKEWQQDLKYVNDHKITLISYFDPQYPAAFQKLSNPPLFLYVKGQYLPQDFEGVGIVGTRQCTIYGKEMAAKFSEEIAGAGVTIVSGLARGIDTAAHQAALKFGRTVAFIGSGLAHIYPGENVKLAEEIAKNGAVISEVPMFAKPEKHHFPKRNRLICGSAKAVLLIEAPIKSGAMITMDLAEKQNKGCFALPGRIDMESFKGNHHLIKTGKAELTDHPDDLLGHLGKNKKNFTQSQLPLFDLEEEEKNLIAHFPAQEVSIEALANISGLPMAKLSALIMGLVLKQIVREFPGKIYKKVF